MFVPVPLDDACRRLRVSFTDGGTIVGPPVSPYIASQTQAELHGALRIASFAQLDETPDRLPAYPIPDWFARAGGDPSRVARIENIPA